jgi:RNA-directed DNA polymerase
MALVLSANHKDLRKSFFSLQSAKDIADLLEIDLQLLYYHLYIRPESARYTSFEIPKRSGGTRPILAPISALKIIQRKLNQVLLSVYSVKPPVHSFVRDRSVATNASVHVKRNYILNIDLLDFFPSINFGRVRGLFMGKPYCLNPKVATILAQICCFNRHLPQGAPTSPIVSNMVCAKMDSQLTQLAKKNMSDYTRYADDITFSTNKSVFPSDFAVINELEQVELGKELVRIISDNGFQINHTKTRLQSRKQRQEVTGVTVNKFTNVRRTYLRSIRAMLHVWEKYGLEKAQDKFWHDYDKGKYRSPYKSKPNFKNVVRGKIEYLGMIRGKDDPLYQRLLGQLRVLAPELVKKTTKIQPVYLQGSQAIVYTEGKTDVLILETAWKKLYPDKPIPFTLKPCDFNQADKAHGTGGASYLANVIKYHPPDHPNVIIGIFDRDHEGIRAYDGIGKSFPEKKGLGSKLAKHSKAGAILLPIPKGKEKYAKYKNLCIEFYFSEKTLNKKNEDGKGLAFQFGTEVIHVAGRPASESKPSHRPEARAITGKDVFANDIVPQLPSSAFRNFKLLFDVIIATLAKCKTKATSH